MPLVVNYNTRVLIAGLFLTTIMLSTLALSTDEDLLTFLHGVFGLAAIGAFGFVTVRWIGCCAVGYQDPDEELLKHPLAPVVAFVPFAVVMASAFLPPRLRSVLLYTLLVANLGAIVYAFVVLFKVERRSEEDLPQYKPVDTE